MSTLPTNCVNPLSQAAHQIERIYLTRGGSGKWLNSDGKDTARAIGIVINKKIHWIDYSIAEFREAVHHFKKLNVIAFDSGEWGVLDHQRRAVLGKKITRINKYNADVFAADSSYRKKALPFSSRTLWWTFQELADRYFPTEPPKAPYYTNMIIKP